jgi:glucokinase
LFRDKGFFSIFITDTPFANTVISHMTSKSDTRKVSIIGMDLGGTKLSAALFSRDGNIIHRSESLLEGKKGPEVGTLVVRKIKELEALAHAKRHRIRSLGICVPGISNPQKRTVWAPNIQGWEAYPLYGEIKEGLSDPDIPVSIESDRNGYILGEMWKGNARHCSNAIFMAVGTGIGIGIVSNGHIINGMSGIAGAIGWMALDRPYREAYDHCGQFEFHASGTGIAQNAETLIQQGRFSQYLKAGKISTRDVFNAFEKDDPVAKEVLGKAIAYWGMAVANLVSLLNPEKIIFGGGVFGPALQFLERIHQEASKWAQPIGMQEVKLEASLLKGDTGLYGAGYMALRNALIH